MRHSSEREIRELLARYPRPFQPMDEPESLGGAGGFSGARLWRYRSARGILVLRLWPPHGPGRVHLEQVHRWLLLTEDLGFVPAPIADRSGRTLQEHAGGFWELAPWMPGAAEAARPPATVRVRSAFAAMAAFHQRLAGERRSGTSPGLGHRHEAVAHLLRGGFDALERAIRAADVTARDEARPLSTFARSWEGEPPGEPMGPARTEPRPPGIAPVDLAMRWLGLARAIAPRLLDPLRVAAGCPAPLQPCLRDARPEHFLFEGDRVTGLVDFGAMGVDCVAGDLARLMGEWLDGDPTARSEALAAYERIRLLEAGEAALIDAFASSSALLIGEHWVRWHYIERRRFDDPSAVAQGIARGLAYLERLALEGESHIPFVRGPWSVVRCWAPDRAGAMADRVSERRTTDHGPRTKGD
jgi:Ser/Thr protein kinase RdoA (MazF antagonist)